MIKRASFRIFDGQSRLRVGILQNEDIFLLKSVIRRQRHDIKDMIELMQTRVRGFRKPDEIGHNF
jgi:hypothetical protein